MPGDWITHKQVKKYMKARSRGMTQAVAATMSGISERTGRTIEQGQRSDPKAPGRRSWRTRSDPLETVWERELVPLLRAAPNLQAITLLEYIADRYPDQYGDPILRTLQRRVKQWRAIEGPAPEVMFRQEHPPGRQGLSDFTLLKQVVVRVDGHIFKHLLYHFRLAFSHWSFVKVIQGGESFTALAEGLQGALQCLGGAPREHRTDSLSAAYKNLSIEAQEDLTNRYRALCLHYGMTGDRNNPGESHENGSVESAHGHLKRRIEQALLLRGNGDFVSIAAYQSFLDTVVHHHNKRNAQSIAIERPCLQALPLQAAVDYTEVRVVVTSSSTVNVRRVTYTVPARLQGETLQVRLYQDRLECYLGHQFITTLVRFYPTLSNRAQQVDYRHVIHSLIKKPQAFRYSQLRQALLPTEDYKAIWTYVDAHMEPRKACKFIVGLLHLAATAECEAALAATVLHHIQHEEPLSLIALQARFKTKELPPPTVMVEQHTLSAYDQLIPQSIGV